MPLLAVAVAVVVSGCSSSSEDGAAAAAADAASARGGTATSGTRLRARFVTGGGARELVGFFDTERNEECTFQRADDGRMRCLPANLTYNEGGLFSDEACQKPVGYAQALCAADAKYAVRLRYDDACNPGPRYDTIRSVVGPVTAPFVSNGSGCVRQGPITAGVRPVELGDAIAWTAFLEGVETSVPAGDVSEVVLVASDGARQHLGYRNDKLGAACTFQVMADGVTRCVPDDARRGPIEYGTSSCTEPVSVHVYENGGSSCGVGPAALWIEQQPGGGTCASAKAVYSLKNGSAASDDETSRYAFATVGAGPSTGAPSCIYAGKATFSSDRRDIEADVTSTLPSVTRIGSGGERLVRALVGGSGQAGLVPGWHDNERDVDCSFERATDGKLRCLPVAAPATIFFTDGSCKSPSRVAVLGQPPCTGPSRYARVTSATCPPTTRIYELGADARDLPGASAETDPGRCVTVAGVNRAYDATEADPSSFVEGVPGTE